MRMRLFMAAGIGMALLGAPAAEAAGCLKGAAVGGVAGHFAGHHAVLGALAGCAIGHHRAKMQQRQQDQSRPAPDSDEQTKM